MHAVSLVMFFLLLSAITSVQSDSPSMARMTMAEFIRVPRQVGITEARRCSSVIYKSQCLSTNFAQNLINDITRCGRLGASVGTASEGLCRQNPDGNYCGSVLIDTDTLTAAGQACTSSCTSECRTLLTSIMTTAGCCLQSNILLTSVLSSFFTVCGLNIPSPCPPSSLTVPSATTTSCSTLEDVQERILQFQCSRKNIQPVLETLNSNSCEESARALENTCSFRNGRYCSEQFPAANTARLFTSAFAACNSNSSCSSACQTQIRSLNSNLGCCINTFNATVRAESGSSALAELRTVTSNALWKACGVTPPGECEIRLNAAASGGVTPPGEYAATSGGVTPPGEYEIRLNAATSVHGHAYFSGVLVFALIMLHFGYRSLYL